MTTCFVFGSLALSMKGDIGKVLYVIPFILFLTLSVSLVEAFCILPNHLAHSLGRLVDLAVDFRYLFVGLVIFVFLASIAMVAGGVLKVQAFPEIEGDVVQAPPPLSPGHPAFPDNGVCKPAGG